MGKLRSALITLVVAGVVGGVAGVATQPAAAQPASGVEAPCGTAAADLPGTSQPDCDSHWMDPGED
ncbi:hypothetical protein JOL79_00505 [Microbispora sp. RL4-1S]|uniref:Uncharacterized protein n=1 Tax=Microbispora oryzae TaxID=2806554 RepID=A0A940WB97_9ACTN|nr:hypothetical protein [Microbispora oryzae]MBP2702275.1 hypothetical protein [Microbispora oryzae]